MFYFKRIFFKLNLLKKNQNLLIVQLLNYLIKKKNLIEYKIQIYILFKLGLFFIFLFIKRFFYLLRTILQ